MSTHALARRRHGLTDFLAVLLEVLEPLFLFLVDEWRTKRADAGIPATGTAFEPPSLELVSNSGDCRTTFEGEGRSLERVYTNESAPGAIDGPLSPL